MSLINEALKKVSTPVNPSTLPPIPDSAFKPVEQPEPTQGSSKLLLGLGVVLVLILCAGTFLLIKSRPAAAKLNESVSAQSATETAVTRPDVTAAQAVAPRSTAAEAVTRPVESARALAAALEAKLEEGDQTVASLSPATATPEPAPAAKTAPPQVPAKNAAVSAPAAPVTVAAQTPQPRVQAIYYRLKGPTAIINGRTVREGDEMNGVRVIAINRTSVEVELGGETRTLRME